MSLADVKIKGKIVPLEEIVAAKAAEREEQRLKRKEAIAKKKQEAKEAGEPAEKKPKVKRDVRSARSQHQHSYSDNMVIK